MKPLILAISSRALFNLEALDKIYCEQGVEAYIAYQKKHELEILAPGAAFPLVKKLLALNECQDNLVDIILLSRNSADTGLRIFNSIKHHQLGIVRAVFTDGEMPYPYLKAFKADLFLSANAMDVRSALSLGYAAAMMFTDHAHEKEEKKSSETEWLKIAFDGDAVLFSDDAERIYQTHGLKAFSDAEHALRDEPMEGGPFKGFLSSLHCIQSLFPADACPIRTALVTARSAPSHERVVKTLRQWKIRIDEAFFLGGLSKKSFLEAFQADIFFDDQRGHCDQTKDVVSTGHVPHGVCNEDSGG
jgi:5'-nucleotidase